MPKVDDRTSAASTFTIENRTELRRKVGLVNAKIEAIEIILNKQDNAEPSSTAADIAAVLRKCVLRVSYA
jgi:hypothetical protein